MRFVWHTTQQWYNKAKRRRRRKSIFCEGQVKEQQESDMGQLSKNETKHRFDLFITLMDMCALSIVLPYYILLFFEFFFTFRLNLHRRRNQLLASATKKNKIKQNSSRKRATEKKRRENERTNNTSSWNIIWNFDTISLCFRVFFSGDMSFRLFNTQKIFAVFLLFSIEFIKVESEYTTYRCVSRCAPFSHIHRSYLPCALVLFSRSAVFRFYLSKEMCTPTKRPN